jgi:methylmalonyl-CoA/ethylmalonyl-CoA epimerase
MTTPATPRGTRLAHIGIAVESLQGILPFYQDLLGLPEVPLDDADGARIVGLAAGEPLVELLEPAVADSPIARCRAAGIRLIDETPRLGAEGKRIAFLHPSATAGVLIELMEY